MRFAPVSAQEVDAQSNDFTPWPAGDYDFEVHDAVDQVSKSGNEMIKLTLHVFHPEHAGQRTVFDYLVAIPSSAFKVRHFAEAIGLLNEYERGELLPHALLNRTGRCKLRIRKGDGQYPDQNQVGDYLPAQTRAAPSAPRGNTAPQQQRGKVHAGVGSPYDDEIPF